MKIVLATQSLDPRTGGPAYSVAAIGKNLHKHYQATKFVTAAGRSYVPDAHRGQPLDILSADVVHNFGIWTAFSHAVAVAARLARRPLVLCPLGMLEPWCLAHHGRRKKLGMRLYQSSDIRAANALHATAPAEAHNLRALGFDVPIAVIPHGIDTPERVDRSRAVPRADGDDRKVCLFMSRLHPKKGLLDLVEAWSRLRPSGWRVVIAGPDEDGYRAKVEHAVARSSLQGEFQFVGQVGGDAKRALMASADLFVLPTYSENFGLVVPEALAYGVPVLTTTGAPWRELIDTGSGWWIEPGVEALTASLHAALLVPDEERRAMGERGRIMVEQRYSWGAIIGMHVELYNWLLGRASKPSFVV